ncbi:hypothetical protein [Embleya sp. NPDC005575]|uniref:hypothetical protein n=1 Tax=Embleya sp. NPDC005575 TaxID=3156892 RepID=UPI0033A8DBB6
MRTGVADEYADREHRGWGMIAAVRESVATGTAWASTNPQAGRDLTDWSAPTGPARLYLVLALVCLGYFVVAWLLRFRRAYRLRRRPEPPTAGRLLDVWEIALLVGGSTRFARVALVAMHRRRQAVIGADRRISLLAPSRTTRSSARSSMRWARRAPPWSGRSWTPSRGPDRPPDGDRRGLGWNRTASC